MSRSSCASSAVRNRARSLLWAAFPWRGSPHPIPPVRRGARFGRSCARLTDARAPSVVPCLVGPSPGPGTLTACKGHSPLRWDRRPRSAFTVRWYNDDCPLGRDRRPRPVFTDPRAGTVVPGECSLSLAQGPSSLANVHCPLRWDRRPRPGDGAHAQNDDCPLRGDRRPRPMVTHPRGGTVVRGRCSLTPAEGPSSAAKDDQHRRISRQFPAFGARRERRGCKRVPASQYSAAPSSRRTKSIGLRASQPLPRDRPAPPSRPTPS